MPISSGMHTVRSDCPDEKMFHSQWLRRSPIHDRRFQILELSLQRENLVASKAQEKLDARHPRKLSGPAGRQPPELVELDRGQHPELSGERGFICLFSQQHRFRNIDQKLSARHAVSPSIRL